MAAPKIHQVGLAVSLSFLIGIVTGYKLNEFEVLKKDVFGKGDASLYETLLEEKIHRMIKLIELGDIPTEMQGEQTLDYLRFLVEDCKEDDCNLSTYLPRFIRLGERDTGAPNLRSYLELCKSRMRRSCALDIYRRTNERLAPVDERTLRAVDMLARQTDKEIQPGSLRYNEYESSAESINHAMVLRALRDLDPVGSKAMLKKRTNKKMALAEFMSKIRQSCVTFLEYIDPIVTLSPSQYHSLAEGPSKLNNWHFYRNRCKVIVNNWENILRDAVESYRIHLKDNRPKRRCFSLGAQKRSKSLIKNNHKMN